MATLKEWVCGQKLAICPAWAALAARFGGDSSLLGESTRPTGKGGVFYLGGKGSQARENALEGSFPVDLLPMKRSVQPRAPTLVA
ncbi:MAG TPA: hypothetical protein DDZ51_01630 [Planctomycetaceae bacterium]|nr:hypothetical protein [Planctomycetaceae bacterium]